MFQVSFGGDSEVLFLVAVRIKDGGGRKGGVEVQKKRDVPVQLKMGGLKGEELQPCEIKSFFPAR